MIEVAVLWVDGIDSIANIVDIVDIDYSSCYIVRSIVDSTAVDPSSEPVLSYSCLD